MRRTNILGRLIRDDAGATAIEYGLIVSLIVIALISSMSLVADEDTGLWAIVSGKVTENMAE
jgi:pilus assembly protein Flp/PilA